MEILSVFKAVLTPQKDQTAESLAFLKPGDKIIGKVLRMEADGRVLIDLGRVQALAQTTVPVQVGQQLSLKVIQTGSPIQLRLDPTTAANPQMRLPQMDLSALFPADIQRRAPMIIDQLLSHGADRTQIGQTPQAPQGASLQSSSAQTPVSTQSAQDAQVFEPSLVDKQGLPAPVRQALMLLKSVLEPLAMDAPISRQTEWVQSAVENRGMLFEVKLAHVLEKGGQEQPPGFQTGVITDTMPHIASRGEGSAAMDPWSVNEAQVKAGGDPLTPWTANRESSNLARMIGGRPQDAIPSSADFEKQDGGQPDETPYGVKTDAEHAAERASKILTHDLKPQLLVLKSYFESLDGLAAQAAEPLAKEAAFLRQIVERVLRHVEDEQHQAVRRAGESEVYQVFTHLLPIKDQSMPVKLKVYYPNKGGPARDDPQHRIALLLDMDQLGMVRADLSMIERHLRIQFYVRDESIRSLFAGQTDTVAQALKATFDQVYIDTKVSKEKIAQFEGEDLQGPPLGRINVKA